MSLSVQYGNITAEEAARLGGAIVKGEIDHEEGSTEPWISQLVADFVVARGARTVLETGCYLGATSLYLIQALERLGGGRFYGCEVDPARHAALGKRLAKLEVANTSIGIHGDVLAFLRNAPGLTFDLAWVDDDHTKPHVTKELQLLYPKMNKGGLILLHDVYGVCDLKTVVQQFGGYSLDLPRLGPAGGLGIIQVP